MRNLFKVILTFLLLCAFSVGAYWVYLTYFRSSVEGDSYIDKQYQFTIGDTRGWQVDYPGEGVYYSLVTVDENDVIISYFSVSPVVKDLSESVADAFEKVRQNCEVLYTEFGGTNFSDSEVTVDGLAGVVCMYDAKGENTEEIIETRQYFLANDSGKQYDYFLFTSNPKGNTEEKEKVDRIVNSFRAD